MNANGPAVCFSKRNPTQVPDWSFYSLAAKQSRHQEGLACVFAVQIESVLPIRVSRYKVSGLLGVDPGAGT